MFKLLFMLVVSCTLIITLAVSAIFLASQAEPFQQTNNSMSLIAFYTPRPLSNQGDLMIVNPVTHEEKGFSLDPGFSVLLAWSPDYRKLAMTYRTAPMEKLSMVTFDITNSMLEKVTQDVGLNITSGSYSPDGSTIHYTANAITSTNVYILQRGDINAQGKPLSGANPQFEGVFWSPIEGLLAAIGDDLRTPADIFLIDMNHHLVMNLTQTSRHESFLSWSPDGSAFAYTFYENGKQQVYVIDIDGRNKRWVSQPKDLLVISDAQWTQNGSSLIYLTRFFGDLDDPPPSQLVRHDLVTGVEQVLVEKDQIFSFDLSPTTDELAYTGSNRQDPSRLCILNLVTFSDWCAKHEVLYNSEIAWGID